MFSQWCTFFGFLRTYCRAYGGLKSILASPMFGIAFIITLISYSRWLDPSWVDDANSMIPDLLGFSLGTYAIIFTIITGRIKRAMRAVPSKHQVSYLESVNATFFHFIFVQVATLIWTFLFKASWLQDLLALWRGSSYPDRDIHQFLSHLGSFVGCLLLVYSVLLVIPAAVAVYQLTMVEDPDEGRG